MAQWMALAGAGKVWMISKDQRSKRNPQFCEEQGIVRFLDVIRISQPGFPDRDLT